MKIRLLILGLTATLLTGCLPEEYDCCYQVLLRYHETVYGTDRYADDIRQTRHFLFDADGNLIREFAANTENRQEVWVGNDLKYGHYTMVSVANATDRTIFEDIETLSAFRLAMGRPIATRQGEQEFDNTDELFWNCQEFEVTPDPFELDCELSNIHCHLHVYVTWKALPRYHGDYILRLYGVPDGYQLGEKGLSIRALDFPAMTGNECTVATTESPYNFELRYDVVTHRYTNDDIPVIRLFIGETAVTGFIDLKRAFQWWGWQPDSDTEQDYWIQIEVQENGDALVNKWDSRGRVLDWLDGGTIAR